MGENAYIDDNSRSTLLFIASDGSGLFFNGRVNPITKALIVEGDVLSSNTSIGSTIPGGTAGSVLFLDIGGTLAQDNANFYYDHTNHFLGLGTDTPDATLSLVGTLSLDLGGDATGDIYFRNSLGFVEALPIGTAGQVLTVVGGLPIWQTPASGNGYDTIENAGTPLTQRNTLNFSNLFLATDSSSPARTDIDIDVVALANDSDFIDELVGNSYFTTSLANDSNFITELTGNSTFQSNIVSIVNSDPSIAIDLASQVTGTLPLANGGTGSSLSDPGANKLWGWDDTDNSIGFWTLGSGLSYDHATHTISATATAGVQSVTGLNTNNTDPANPVVQISVDGTTITGQGTPGDPLVASGAYIVTSVLNLKDDFVGGRSSLTEPSSGVNYSGGELGWQGSADNNGDPIAVNIDGEANHPGILSVKPGIGKVSYIYLNPFIPMVNGGQYQFIVRPKTGNVNTDVLIGFVASGSTPGAIQDNGINVLFDANSGNIKFETRDTTTTESTTIGSYSTNTWYTVLLETTSTSVTVTITGFSPVTHSTHVPSSSTTSFPVVYADSGASNDGMEIDCFSIYQPVLIR